MVLHDQSNENGRLIMYNMTYICSTPTTTEQYLKEQINRETGQLEDIFMETRFVKQDQVFHPYTTHTQTHGLHNNRQEEGKHSTAIQQSPQLIPDIVCDGKPDCAMRSNLPQNMIMKSDQSIMKGEIRTR